MGVLGAFIFAAQMINFTIPVTGSSGHLGGGLLLAILLGPYAAFLTIASVLVVQALFFADGGLLALGCNIFNMGFLPSFLVYPYVYKRIIGDNPGQVRLTIAIMVSAIIGLQLGPFSVVLETLFSGISALPFSTFMLLMQPIHLAIGVVEGLVTAAIISFVYKARPEILRCALEARPIGSHPIRNVVLTFMVAALIAGGIVSWFASKNPDGLEWAITKITGKEKLEGPNLGFHGTLASIQERIAFLPGYSFKNSADMTKKKTETFLNEPSRFDHRFAASISGLVGGLITLGMTLLIGLVLKLKNRPT
jgi:cobalt/nickel transport system permease protein